VNALKHVPNSKVVACAARSLKNAQEFAKVHGIPAAYGSYEELVKDKNVQIVYIGSLHRDHYEQTILSLNHGKHVLVEKPAAMNSQELKTMYELAEKKGLFLMEGVWTFFFPAFKKIQELIASGAIGEVNFVQVDFGVFFPPSFDRIWKNELAGGALLDIGIYSVSITTMLINGGKEPPIDIKASGHFDRGVDSLGTAILKYNGNKLGIAIWNGLGRTPGEIIVAGTRGHIRVLGPMHHPRDIIVHRVVEDGSHLLDDKTETTRYHFPFPVENLLARRFNFSGSIAFVHEITAVQEDIIQRKTSSDTYPPRASMIVGGILDEIRKQVGIKYVFEKSKL
jgi:dihydrodiol dehydrogenase / D-xylose 1-dehydrogenase (NADP)